MVGVTLLDANRCQENQVVGMQAWCAVAANEALLQPARVSEATCSLRSLPRLFDDTPQQNAIALGVPSVAPIRCKDPNDR